MSLMTLSFLGVMVLVIGYVIGNGKARWVFATKTDALKKRMEEQMTQLRQEMCADVQAQGELISERLGQLVEERYGPSHQLAALRSNFDVGLKKELELAANDPIQASKIANEMFPDLWLAIGRALEKNEVAQAAAKKQQSAD